MVPAAVSVLLALTLALGCGGRAAEAKVDLMSDIPYMGPPEAAQQKKRPRKTLDLDADDGSSNAPGKKGGTDEGYYGGMDKNLAGWAKVAAWDAGYDGNVGVWVEVAGHRTCEGIATCFVLGWVCLCGIFFYGSWRYNEECKLEEKRQRLGLLPKEPQKRSLGQVPSTAIVLRSPQNAP